ncbi:GAF domain-containing protein [Chloroflexota bacterium]
MTNGNNYTDNGGNKKPESRSTVAYDATDLLMRKGTRAPIWSEIHNNDAEASLKHTAEEKEDYKTRLALLYKVGKKVGSVSQMARLVERITRMTQKTLNASASSVLLLDEQRQELLFEVAEGQAGKRLRRIILSAQSGIAGWVAQNGKPLIINDVGTDPRFNKSIDESTGFITKSIICAPLTVHSKVIGVIEVLNKLDRDGFSGQDLETLV